MSKRDRMTPPSIVPNHNPRVRVPPVTDPGIIDLGRAFAEAHNQMAPLARPGTAEAGCVARFSERMTARPGGLSPATALEQATRIRSIDALLASPQCAGSIKEFIVTLDVRDLYAGRDPGIVNAPRACPSNVIDIRTSADNACKRDIVFLVRMRNGCLFVVPGAQVKTGAPRYIAQSLVQMAAKHGYGRLAYVDGRFVNTDGTPRVAPDAFTADQARRLREAGVKLRGIRDLDSRGEKLTEALSKSRHDGLDPMARKQLEMLRDDIARAYGARQIAGRVVSGAALAAATSVIVALSLQLAMTGTVNPRALWDSLCRGAASGTVGALADSSVFHATVYGGLAPETAKLVAQYCVAAGFATIAISADITHELRALRAGDISRADAAVGIATKVALDLVPLAVAPLGLIGLPIVIGMQLGARWLLAQWRDGDAQLRAIAASACFNASARRDADAEATAATLARCSETELLYAEVFGLVSPVSSPN